VRSRRKENEASSSKTAPAQPKLDLPVQTRAAKDSKHVFAAEASH